MRATAPNFAADDVFPIATPEIDDLHPALAQAVRSITANAAARSNPFFVNVAGVPGAGKSSLLAPLAEKLAAEAPVIIAFDRLMEMIPAYRAEPDREAAFHTYEAPAREAGYALIKALMAKRAHIIFEHSSALPAHVDLLRFMGDSGYRTCMVRLTAPLDVAKHRVDERQSRVGRHTPHSFVDERARIFEGLLPRYRAVVPLLIELVNTERDADTRAAFFTTAAADIAARLL